MPDYGSGYETGFSGDQTNKYKGGRGQDNNPNAGDSGAKKSLEDQLEAMRKGYEDQLAADAEEAMRLQEESFDQQMAELFNLGDRSRIVGS